ncbi:MAG TPA: hypothetical protein VK121_03045 [Pseudogracilibacillus sp.]|nr:hypothetical protein [Pseudogracilibacillus sp.]
MNDEKKYPIFHPAIPGVISIGFAIVSAYVSSHMLPIILHL